MIKLKKKLNKKKKMGLLNGEIKKKTKQIKKYKIQNIITINSILWVWLQWFIHVLECFVNSQIVIIKKKSLCFFLSNIMGFEGLLATIL